VQRKNPIYKRKNSEIHERQLGRHFSLVGHWIVLHQCNWCPSGRKYLGKGPGWANHKKGASRLDCGVQSEVPCRISIPSDVRHVVGLVRYEWRSNLKLWKPKINNGHLFKLPSFFERRFKQFRKYKEIF
jgi:hypothetical protein